MKCAGCRACEPRRRVLVDPPGGAAPGGAPEGANQCLCGVCARCARDATTWMRARAGEEESFDRRLITADAVEGAPLRKLIKTFIDVHRVTTRCAPVVL